MPSFSSSTSRSKMEVNMSVLLLIVAGLTECLVAEKIEYPLLMPDVQPLQKDTYFCTAFKLPRHEHEYIVEFSPHATQDTAHHILIYGCEVPGYYERDTPRSVWDCGEMSLSGESGFPKGPTCSKGSSIVYAWAKDAPKLVLPEGVGFKVGGTSGINFLVLQVHYAHVDKFLNGATDNSGIVLTMLPQYTEHVTKRAGVLLLGTGGSIPPHRVEHMETTCRIGEPLVLHPFAFRTHTHKLGTAVTGWKIDRSGTWTLIGRHDPQLPQMFYPVENTNLIIEQSDVLAARCTMNNTLSHHVDVGSTGNDEMCNFYIMYYTDGDQTLSNKYCFSAGPPYYYWQNDPSVGRMTAEIDRQASRPQ